MTTPWALAAIIALVALASLVVRLVWLSRRDAPTEKPDNWPVTEATIQSVGKVIGSGRSSCPLDVGDFSYVVNEDYYSGRATISPSFSTHDRQPADLVNKKFQLRYNPRKPDKYDLSESDVESFLLDRYDDFLMHDIDSADIDVG